MHTCNTILLQLRIVTGNVGNAYLMHTCNTILLQLRIVTGNVGNG
jgi:hypothetical protein